MSSLLARKAARTAVLSKGAGAGTTSPVRSKGSDDPTKTLHYLNTLVAGSTVEKMKRRGPVLTYTGNGGTSMIWDENATLVSTTNNQPRFDHDPVTGAARGLRVESAAEEVLLQTEDFETTWTIGGSNTTLTAAAGTAPDGETTATDMLHLDSAEVVQQICTVIANTVYTLSVPIHSGTTGTHDWVQINFYSGGNGFQAWFDLTDAGAVGTNQTFGSGATLIAASVQSIGGGWYRIFLTGQLASGATTTIVEIHNQTADGSGTEEATNSAWWWGANLVPGRLSSYIPATTGKVTRTAEAVSATVTSLLGSANTMVIAARTGYGAGVVWQIDDGTENERYRIERNSSNELRLFVTDGGSEQVGASGLNLGTVADDIDFKLAIRLAANDFASSLDGAAVVTDTSGTLPTVTTSRFGIDTSGDEWNSTIKWGKMFGVGKPNGFLQSSTA